MEFGRKQRRSKWLLKEEMLLSRHEKSLDRSSRFSDRQRKNMLKRDNRGGISGVTQIETREEVKGERTPDCCCRAERAKSQCTWERGCRVYSRWQAAVEYSI